MRTTSRHAVLAVLVAAVGSSSLVAQEPVREFCRDAEFPDLCPGEDCPCVDDTLEIVFEGQLESSIHEYDEFDPDETIRGRVVLDTVTPDVRAYSFGVRHDAAFINLVPGSLGLNIDGGSDSQDLPTVSAMALSGGFVVLREIRPDGVPRGFIAAFVLSFESPVVLPLGRARLVNCNYRLERDVGPEGTLLRFSEALGNPRTQVILTTGDLEFPRQVERPEGNCIDQVDNDLDGLVDRDDPDCVVSTGISRRPRTLIDAVVRRRVERAGFHRGDTDGDGTVDLLDAVRLTEIVVGLAPPAFDCDPLLDANDDGQVDLSDAVTLIEHAVRGGPPLAEPFTRCGEDETFDQLVCLAPSETSRRPSSGAAAESGQDGSGPSPKASSVIRPNRRRIQRCGGSSVPFFDVLGL